MPVNGASNDDSGVRKMSYMVKRSQGKSSFGAINFKKRVFVLTDSKLTYFDGTMEVRCHAIITQFASCVFVYLVALSRLDTSSSEFVYCLLVCSKQLEYSVCYYRNVAVKKEWLISRK